MDLHEFLKILEEEHELAKVNVAVDPKHELGAICKIHNERANSPAFLFEKVKGHSIPVVGQLLASDRRVALAFGLSEKNVFEETVKRASDPQATRLVSSGPCQEMIFEGQEYGLQIADGNSFKWFKTLKSFRRLGSDCRSS
jgi:UbiD family decarboxylase